MTTQSRIDVLSRKTIQSGCSKRFTEPFQNPQFLSEGNIKRLLSAERIAATLQANLPSSSPYWISKYVEYVQNGAGKVFLTLAFSGHVSKIGRLYEENFRNKNMPICNDEDWNFFSIGQTHRNPWRSFSNAVNGEDIEAFAAAFEIYQWVFLVPSFSWDRFNYDFYAQQPLPFLVAGLQNRAVPQSHSPLAEGSFGSVRNMQIPAEHFQSNSSATTTRSTCLNVAVKSLKLEGSASQRAEFFTREKSTLETMRDLKHRHLIHAYAAYERGDDRGFVFPWADRGSLSQLWERGRRKLDQDLLTWTVFQVKGLVEGIKMLHDRRTRHGDLKPENILVFSNKFDIWGDLVIADVGLAKFHALYTRERYDPTTTRHGSRRYEPPEVDLEQTTFSRRYDMWSLGCILLEFVIWVVHGYPGLQAFYRYSGKRAHFWESNPYLRLRPIIVNHIHHLLDFLRRHYPREFALKRILNLVEKRLLIVDVERRAYSRELWPEIQSIDGILPLDSFYEFDDNLPELTPGQPVTISATQANHNPLSQTYPVNIDKTFECYELNRDSINDIWQVVTSNTIAGSILDQLDWQCPIAEISHSVCLDCQKLELWRSEIELDRSTQAIKNGSAACTVCKLLSHCLSRANIESSKSLRLYRQGFLLRDSRMGQPLISIYCDPGSNDDITSYAQIGLVQLPERTSPKRFGLLREFLRICDEGHACYRINHEPFSASSMPTRVLDVGTDEDSIIRLVETLDSMQNRYIALSHCWGQAQGQSNCCTTIQTIAQFREKIDFEKLPRTFQDAITITRSLRVRYLWIDSLCIVQGHVEDWAAEAKKMEDYYSSAYVTIAASSAASSLDGMLIHRPKRACATIPTANGHIHLAEAIDDFQADVEKSVLNTRAWVLQERALSRRTIHFTSTQIYWECGQGVHCETLAQLHNPRSQCIGDHDFPNMGLTYYKNERINFIHYLHRLYSGLNLTKASDRSVAIAGLHNRMGRTFGSRFDYGILWKYFERLILWRARNSSSLSRIPNTRDACMPSWSWLAYEGEIGYLDIPYSKIQWLGDIQMPFSKESMDETFDGCLTAKARWLTIGEVDLYDRVIMDQKVWSDFDGKQWMCITVGRMKGDETSKEVPHYVLIVRPSKDEKSAPFYERIGVGILTTSHFSAAVKDIMFI